MADLIGILLVAMLSYMLGWLSAHAVCFVYQERSIAAQKDAIAAQERAIWAAKKAEELVGPKID